MTLPTLIDKVDNSEVIRDQIAAILAAETVSQQALAVTAAKDPKLWTFRVFSERHNPWEQFLDADATVDSPPIVNVWVDSLNYEPAASNVVARQKTSGTYNIDVYGFGRSEDVFGGGHTPGDRVAATEAQRGVRLVRNILMAAENTYLQLQGTVWRRWLQSVTIFQPQIDAQFVQKIVAARIALLVDFNSLSPQGEEAFDVLDLVAATVKRTETGEVYLDAHYD